MSVIKPKPLRQGDCIGIVAPASPPASEELLANGIRYLEQLGYRIELGQHIYHRRGYLAGSDEERAADLHQLFANPKVKAIFTVRGGYGSLRILPLLNFPLIQRNPKIFMGYSDVTALQMAFYTRLRLVTFSGPMVAVEMAEGLKGKAEEMMWHALTSPKPLGTIRIRKRDHVAFIRGRSTGTIIGGNLTMISTLIGSRYFPREEGHILLMEEIDERPYRIDRMLYQMKRTKFLQQSSGILLGKFIGCEPAKGRPSLSLRQVIQDIFEPMNIPVLGHLHHGHVANPLTVPLGVRVTMDASRGTLQFLESGVA